VPEALSVADVVVIPQRAGRGAEGQMPAKVIDAMAMGRAIVATRVGQLPEALAGCADFVEPGDVKGLAAAIRRALENPEVYSAMREKARQVFLENYSYSKVAPGLVSLVGRVLASRPPRTK
jgi:glycosyltransferase involved in cell wall biosynthesis